MLLINKYVGYKYNCKAEEKGGKSTLKIASDFVLYWINISKLTNQMLERTNINKKGLTNNMIKDDFGVKVINTC